jgi:hypothetical protein
MQDLIALHLARQLVAEQLSGNEVPEPRATIGARPGSIRAGIAKGLRSLADLLEPAYHSRVRA